MRYIATSSEKLGMHFIVKFSTKLDGYSTGMSLYGAKNRAGLFRISMECADRSCL
jgi:hypothetical protein